MALALGGFASRPRTRSRLLAVRRLATQTEKRQRASLEIEHFAPAAHLLRRPAGGLARVEQELPPEPRLVRRKHERQRLVVGIEEDQQGIANDPNFTRVGYMLGRL